MQEPFWREKEGFQEWAALAFSVPIQGGVRRWNLVLLQRYCCHYSVLSGVRLSATPWTVAHQAPLSMGLFRQEYWSGLPFPPPGDFPDPGMNLCLLCLLHCRQILYPLNHQGSPISFLNSPVFGFCPDHNGDNTKRGFTLRSSIAESYGISV